MGRSAFRTQSQDVATISIGLIGPTWEGDGMGGDYPHLSLFVLKDQHVRCHRDVSHALIGSFIANYEPNNFSCKKRTLPVM